MGGWGAVGGAEEPGLEEASDGPVEFLFEEEGGDVEGEGVKVKWGEFIGVVVVLAEVGPVEEEVFVHWFYF